VDRQEPQPAFDQADYLAIRGITEDVQQLIQRLPGGPADKLLAARDPAGKIWDKWRNTLNRPPRLAGADLEGLQLTGADLSGADLTGANLSHTHGFHMRLYGAIANHARATNCIWQLIVTLKNATLQNADFSNAQLGVIILDGDWSGANWSHAHVDFIKVEEGLRLDRMNLTGCKLNQGKNGSASALAHFRTRLSPEQTKQLT
jgi:uncharacterized protein YjbI with pentapeptide repeats